MTEVRKLPRPKIKAKPVELPKPVIKKSVKPVVLKTAEPEELVEWREDGLKQLAEFLSELVAKQLEQAVYQGLYQTYREHDLIIPNSHHFQRFYQFQIRDLRGLINPQDRYYQVWLRDGLNEGKLKVDDVVRMKPWELSPKAWQPVIQQFEKELSSLGKTNQASSSLFECGRCHKKDTSYYEMQSRSSDEPMTTYITCNNCGNHWKQ